MQASVIYDFYLPFSQIESKSDTTPLKVSFDSLNFIYVSKYHKCITFILKYADDIFFSYKLLFNIKVSSMISIIRFLFICLIFFIAIGYSFYHQTILF